MTSHNSFLVIIFKILSLFIFINFIGQLKDEIITCSLTAEDALRKWNMESPLVTFNMFLIRNSVINFVTRFCNQIHDVAISMYTLCMNIREDIQELNECNALLREISEAETIEASLRIQKV